ncbi:MAG: biotin/lipoyl-binding protein, partial [Coxiellaceae bacterium]|nr:biotin/lipoyl-binding protein [Coxiellaceae bacterium]
MKKHVILLMAIAAVMVAGCNKSDRKPSISKMHTITAQTRPQESRLFYSGTIKPIKVNTITSPVEGVVANVNFTYGQIVDKGQLVLHLHSEKLQNEFHDAVTTYLKNKEAFNISRSSFEGTEKLYQENIIARHEYTNENTDLENNEMSYLDAKFKLEQLIQ